MKCATKHKIVILAVIILLQTVFSARHRKKQFPVQRPRVNRIKLNLDTEHKRYEERNACSKLPDQNKAI